MKQYCIHYKLTRDGIAYIHDEYFNSLDELMKYIEDCGVADYTVYECTYKELSNLDLLSAYSQEIGMYE